MNRKFVFPVKINLLIFNALLIIFNTLNAQKAEPCGADFLLQKNLQHFPELLENYTRFDSEAFPSDSLAIGERSEKVLTIPVVVHVVYQSAAENISDAQIRSQIDVLNQDFRRRNANVAETPPEFLPFAADFEIEFCLATTDPAGKPTTGIVRRGTSWDNIASQVTPSGALRVCHSTLGGSDAWDTQRYLNIWVARIGNGFLGMATYPGSAPADEDGVFIDPRYFGTTGLTHHFAPNHLGRTCVHEVGHYLNLKHIWGDVVNSCDADDGVGDTPRQKKPTVGCPPHPQTSCNSHDMFMNFMDYTSDACMNLFTQGQKARAWASLQTSRKNLFQQQVCKTVSVAPEALPLTVQLFPNPASEELLIELNHAAHAPHQVQIFNTLGVPCGATYSSDSAGSLRLHIAHLPAGMYFLHLVVDRQSKILPFLKV